MNLITFNSVKQSGTECPICYERFGYHYALFNCTHYSCVECADSWLSKTQRCPFCRRRTTSYRNMGIPVVVIPDEGLDSPIQEQVEVEEEEVVMTGFSFVVNGQTIFSSFGPPCYECE